MIGLSSIILRATLLLLMCSFELGQSHKPHREAHKWKGIYDFPKKDHNGRETANEFQFIEPSNIGMYPQTTGVYQITNISPLWINNNDEITVSFSSTTPASGDWIAAYSPANVDIKTTVPVKYGWCGDDPNYVSSKQGALTFNMTNLRSDIRFVYFVNGTKRPQLVANSSMVVRFNNVNEQLRPRVQATGNYNVLNISWSSNMSLIPVLKWGVMSGQYDHVSYADTTRIRKGDMCNAPASTYGWRDLGEIHTASLVGAAALANQPVYYMLGDEASGVWSKEYKLFLPPLPGANPPNRPTTVVLFDDLGRGSMDMSYTWNEYGRPSINTTMSVGAEVAEGKIDAIYHGGDISYATGYMAVWDFFLDMISPMSGSCLYLTTVGNHESDAPNTESYFNGNDSGGECGVAATELLQMPYPATTNQPWWSYDVGLIHFVGISTEHNFTIGSPQYVWLENDLKTVDRSITPWIIFGGHRAMYINSNYNSSVSSDTAVMSLMIANIEPLLYKYRVNLGFYGHNHAVQRMSAVYDSKVVQASTMVRDSEGNDVAWHEDPQATVHMVVGTGGASFTKNFIFPYPEWCEKVFYQYGYAKVTAMNATYLDWVWIDSSDNKIYDRMVITQTTDFSRPWGSSTPSTDDNSGNDNDKILSGVELAFIVIGCALFVSGVGYVSYRMVRSTSLDNLWGSDSAVALSALHDESSALHKGQAADSYTNFVLTDC